MVFWTKNSYELYKNTTNASMTQVRIILSSFVDVNELFWTIENCLRVHMNDKHTAIYMVLSITISISFRGKYSSNRHVSGKKWLYLKSMGIRGKERTRSLIQCKAHILRGSWGNQGPIFLKREVSESSFIFHNGYHHFISIIKLAKIT